MTTQTPDKPLILLVDDTPSNLHVLAASLKADYRIKLATHGEEALSLCRRDDQPQLVVLDVMMPDMSGLEVLQHLRRDSKTNAIPVLFLSADTSEKSQLEGLELGADDYLTKPVNPKLLQARVRNILRRKQAEDRVLELNATLEERVAQRTAELESATTALHQTMEELSHSEAQAALSIMVASITHELGTPLGNSLISANALDDFARELQTKVDTGQLKRSDLSDFLDTLRNGVDLLQRNLQRASGLLGNFKQLAADQASEQRREFDLSSVINDIVVSLQPSHKRHPHRIALKIPDGITMDSFPGPLGQIGINLINNAYLHGFEGRKDGVLTISAEAVGQTVELIFSDNGNGIPSENLERLFDPFFSTKIGKGGSGLGMTIIKSLVCKPLGGDIEVSSTPGLGTRFRITLPCMAPTP